MYDPMEGRWLEEDPIDFAGGDTNLYRYLKNSPTNGTDPTGTQLRDPLKNLKELQEGQPFVMVGHVRFPINPANPVIEVQTVGGNARKVSFKLTKEQLQEGLEGKDVLQYIFEFIPRESVAAVASTTGPFVTYTLAELAEAGQKQRLKNIPEYLKRVDFTFTTDLMKKTSAELMRQGKAPVPGYQVDPDELKLKKTDFVKVGDEQVIVAVYEIHGYRQGFIKDETPGIAVLTESSLPIDFVQLMRFQASYQVQGEKKSRNYEGTFRGPENQEFAVSTATPRWFIDNTASQGSALYPGTGGERSVRWMIDIPNAQFAIRATVESEKKPAEAITASFIGATYLVVDSSPIYRIDWMSTVGGLEPGISLKPTPNWKEATLGKAHSEVLKRFSGNPIIKPSLLQE